MAVARPFLRRAVWASNDALAAAEHLPGVAGDASRAKIALVARQLDEIDGVAREALLEVHHDGAAIRLQHVRPLVLEVARGGRDAEARRVEGRLRVHAAVEQIRGDLHMPLRLHKPSHDAERGVELTSIRHHARYNCVVRPLPGPETIRMPLLQHEVAAACVEINH